MTSPPSSGLTLTVSLNVLPGQPASAGFTTDSVTIANGSIRATISPSRVILENFLNIKLPSLVNLEY